MMVELERRAKDLGAALVVEREKATRQAKESVMETVCSTDPPGPL